MCDQICWFRAQELKNINLNKELEKQNIGTSHKYTSSLATKLLVTNNLDKYNGFNTVKCYNCEEINLYEDSLYIICYKCSRINYVTFEKSLQGFPTIEVICPVCYVNNFSSPEQTLHRCYNCGLVMSSSSNLNYTKEEHKSVEQSDV
ncbi:uncharacterized protein CMU_025120 [Cryptosporidium muris RN66]|uniref:Uncharacterized protein n=1 Tax=Cryptosporidium muris (strain RN66) TaxID=441375 RepID=B6AAV4_CRYMR|nr:uncharacterized protein CMU_025120 [Cryptosporidium muris RN66]EEA05506.1 hypothetical protein CMU_025120 [Cryptosporidium muris RN66]|eukprot:XP_002139855.1 hypothetical protein [Cryptosporidium muris RN66]